MSRAIIFGGSLGERKHCSDEGVMATGNRFGTTTNEFRNALKVAAAKRGTALRMMGLYDIALAAGRPGLGGFAPVAGAVGIRAGQKPRVLVPACEAGSATVGRSAGQVDAGVLAARQGHGEETFTRAVVAQARRQAAAARAQREAERALLHLPARGAGYEGMSFAPPAGGGAAGGGAVFPARPGSAAALGLRRRGSVHDALSAAEAAAADQDEVESQGLVAGGDAAPARVAQADIEQALETYFYRQSRLPPSGAAGFNPLLSPVWAGLKIPG
jgi:hypothetical protein